MIIFAQVFHFIDRFPPEHRTSLILRLFVISVLLILGLVGLAAWGITSAVESRQLKELELKAAMHDAMAQAKYQAAELYADDLLKINPASFSAWNVKGSVAFYSRKFAYAAQCFEKAESDAKLDATSKRAVLKNLGDAHLETGATTKAIAAYGKIQPDGQEDLAYRLGRAYLYDDRYSEALPLLQSVATSFEYGKARVLEAAALVGLSRTESNPTKRSNLMSMATEKLREGISQRPDFWMGVLDRGLTDKGEGYGKVRELLEGIPRPVFN